MMNVLCAVLVLATSMAFGQSAKKTTKPSTPPEVSNEFRVQLKLAYLTVLDLDPLGDGFTQRDSDARKETRKTEAMASSPTERTAAEHLETFRIVYGACRYQTTAADYTKCADDAQTQYGAMIRPMLGPVAKSR